MFTDTSGKLARDAEASVPTVLLYARLGLLEFITASNGVKLFKNGQASLVRDIKRQRLEAKTRRSA